MYNNKYLSDTGYTVAVEQMEILRAELDELQAELEQERKIEAANTERKAIEESGLSEAEYFRKQAVKEYGYTPYFYDAGYIVPNGKMLNFSGEKGKSFGARGLDHRNIERVFADTRRTEAMLRFMGYGNIRILPAGVDISSTIAPTKEQYATIRKFVREHANSEYFGIDFTDAEGRTVRNYEYDGRISAERVVNDIK